MGEVVIIIKFQIEKISSIISSKSGKILTLIVGVSAFGSKLPINSYTPLSFKRCTDYQIVKIIKFLTKQGNGQSVLLLEV